MTKLYIDLDGVLADFDAHHFATFGEVASKERDNVDWERVRAIPGYYASIPPMADAVALWSFVRPYGPTVLTGAPKLVPSAGDEKRAWVAAHFDPNAPVITCRSKNKSDYCSPGDILVDDWEKYRARWEAKGGIWITHTSAAATIHALKERGFRVQ